MSRIATVGRKRPATSSASAGSRAVDAFPRQIHAQQVASLLQQGADASSARVRIVLMSTILLELDLAPCDTGNIEQVIHLPSQVSNLALDDRVLAIQRSTIPLCRWLAGWFSLAP